MHISKRDTYTTNRKDRERTVLPSVFVSIRINFKQNLFIPNRSYEHRKTGVQSSILTLL